jgi:cell division protein FtsB
MSTQSPPRKTAERVAPRRRTPKRSVWRRTIWPLAKLLVVVGVVALVVTGAITKAVRPVRLLHREHAETRKVRDELESLKKENADLERRIKYLQTPQGAAMAARKLGYVKQGEELLVLPEPESAPKHKAH